MNGPIIGPHLTIRKLVKVYRNKNLHATINSKHVSREKYQNLINNITDYYTEHETLRT